MATDKKWASNSLRHQRNSCLVSLAALSLLNSDTVHELRGRIVLIRPGEIIFNVEPTDRTGQRLEFPLSQLSDDYDGDHENFRASLYEYWKYARRNLVKEGFEAVLAYAADSKQLADLKESSWFPFARIIRNCVSHDMHFRFRKKDLAELPVTYGPTTLDASLQDTLMLDTHLDHYLALELHREMEEWVAAH